MVTPRRHRYRKSLKSSSRGKKNSRLLLVFLLSAFFSAKLFLRLSARRRQILFFSIPKCNEEAADRERLAARSWAGQKNSRVLLFGDKHCLCRTHDCNRIVTAPVPEVSELGVPIIPSFFGKAQSMGNDEMVFVYLNADIILPESFSDTVQRSLKLMGQPNKYLMVGERTDVDVYWNESCIYSDCLWNQIRSMESTGVWAIDYFVHSKNTWPAIPRFLLGRYAWDNWLLHSALSRDDVRTLDLSNVVSALHPRHTYPHFRPASIKGEIEHNRKLAGDEWKDGNLHNVLNKARQCGVQVCLDMNKRFT